MMWNTSLILAISILLGTTFAQYGPIQKPSKTHRTTTPFPNGSGNDLGPYPGPSPSQPNPFLPQPSPNPGAIPQFPGPQPGNPVNPHQPGLPSGPGVPQVPSPGSPGVPSTGPNSPGVSGLPSSPGVPSGPGFTQPNPGFPTGNLPTSSNTIQPEGNNGPYWWQQKNPFAGSSAPKGVIHVPDQNKPASIHPGTSYYALSGQQTLPTLAPRPQGVYTGQPGNVYATSAPYTGPLNTTPYPGCAAALKCVDETFCTAEGVMSDRPVQLTREQIENRVPLSTCQDLDTGLVGKCCRDPNYKDPWPNMDPNHPHNDGDHQHQHPDPCQGQGTCIPTYLCSSRNAGSQNCRVPSDGSSGVCCQSYQQPQGTPSQNVHTIVQQPSNPNTVPQFQKPVQPGFSNNVKKPPSPPLNHAKPPSNVNVISGQPQPGSSQPLPIPSQPNNPSQPTPLPLPFPSQPSQNQLPPLPSQPNYNNPQPFPSQPSQNQPQPNPSQPGHSGSQPIPSQPSQSYPRPNPSQPGHLPSQPGQPIPSQPGHPFPSHPGQSNPSHPGQSIPSQTFPSQPGHSNPSNPGQPIPSQTFPSQPGQSNPSNPGQPTPSQPFPSQPGHSTPSQPGQTGQSYPRPIPSQPGHSTPSQPGQTGQSYPRPIPSQPGQPFPSQPGQPFPSQPGQPTPSQPGHITPSQPGQPTSPQPSQPSQNYPRPIPSQPGFPSQPSSFPQTSTSTQTFVNPQSPRPNQPVPSYPSPGSSQNPTLVNPGKTCGVRRQGYTPAAQSPLQASFAEFPWHVLIISIRNQSALCSGALIRNDAVLAPAHCLKNLPNEDIIVKAGLWNLNGNGQPQPPQQSKLSACAKHPSYESGTFFNDLAVLMLAQPFIPDTHIDTICLPPRSSPGSRKNCIATGWGKTVLQGISQPQPLNQIQVNYIDSSVCQEKLRQTFLGKYFQLNPSFECALPISGTEDLCKVDMGSPIACQKSDGHYELSGIYSWDVGCTTTQNPTVIARPDVDWIEATLSKTPEQITSETKQEELRKQLAGQSEFDTDSKPGFSQDTAAKLA